MNEHGLYFMVDIVQHIALLVSVGVRMLFKSDIICTVNKCLCISFIFIIDINIKVPEYDYIITTDDFVLQILKKYVSKVINRCDVRLWWWRSIYS